VTTRMENTNVVKEKENAEMKKYLGSVNGHEDYQATVSNLFLRPD
jgi:hypothetical protein